MAISKAQQKAVAKYNLAHYDRVELRLPKGYKAILNAHVCKAGVSINKHIVDLIMEDIQKGAGSGCNR